MLLCKQKFIFKDAHHTEMSPTDLPRNGPALELGSLKTCRKFKKLVFFKTCAYSYYVLQIPTGFVRSAKLVQENGLLLRAQTNQKISRLATEI